VLRAFRYVIIPIVVLLVLNVMNKIGKLNYYDVGKYVGNSVENYLKMAWKRL